MKKIALLLLAGASLLSTNVAAQKMNAPLYPQTADIRQCKWDVRKVPITDIAD